MTNGESAVKKAKEKESNSDDWYSDEDNRNKKPVVNGKAAPVQKMEESRDESNREDEKTQPNLPLRLRGRTEFDFMIGKF